SHLRVVPGIQRVAIELPRSVPRYVRLVDAAGRPVDDASIRVVDEGAPAGRERPFWYLQHEASAIRDDVDTDAAGRADIVGAPVAALRLSIERRLWEHGDQLFGDRVTREVVLGADDGVRTVAELHWPER